VSAVAPPDRPDRLSLFHIWVGFGLFGVASLLGLYQLLERNGLVPTSAATYYQSMTLHGVVMAFVLTTFFIVGYGYFVTVTSLGRPIPWRRLPWLGFATMLAGTLVAALAIASGTSTVLYTFYPPMVAHWSFYLGAALLLVGSLPWTVITITMTVRWKRENPGRPIPLPQFGMTACAILWSWTLVGVVIEVVFQLLPLSLGLVQTIELEQCCCHLVRGESLENRRAEPNGSGRRPVGREPGKVPVTRLREELCGRHINRVLGTKQSLDVVERFPCHRRIDCRDESR